ncbi:MAG TPA: hypothetical protein VF917_11800 [Steroidobacteraceae bacterium]
MSGNNSKPAPKPGANAPGKTSAQEADAGAKSNGGTGRVQFDDRGNAIWEWSIATGAFGREVSTARLRSLEHPALSIADDAPTPSETVRANPLGTKKGYNPYDSGKLGKPAAPPRKKDLRRLSEFFKLKKQAAGNKNDEE